MVLHGQLGLQAVGEQGLVAGTGQHQGGVGDLAAGAGGGVGVGGSLGLEVGGQGVAHAGHQQTGGGLAHHVGVHQHHIGVGRQPQILLKDALVAVNHGQGGAGGVGARDGGHDDHGLAGVVSHSLGGVVDLAAADAHHHGGAQLVQLSLQAVDLILGALAVKILKVDGAAGGLEALLHLSAHPLVAGLADEHKGALPQGTGVGADIVQLALALNVLSRRNNDVGHMSALLLFI